MPGPRILPPSLARVVVGLCVTASVSRAQLPRLVEVTPPALDSLGPERANAAVAIAEDGRVAFTGGYDAQDRLIRLLGSDGRLLQMIGKRGRGPGELDGALQLAFLGPDLLVLEVGNRRLTRFAPDGATRYSRVARRATFLVSVSGDSLDVLELVADAAVPRVDFRRIAPETAEGRTLLSGASRAATDLASDGHIPGTALPNVTYTAIGDLVAAVNIRTYALRWVGRDGAVRWRSQGPAQADVGAAGQLHAAGGLQHDGRDRIWTFGDDSKLRRTFADVWVGDRRIGRLMLPCQGAVTVRGARLVVLCRGDAKSAEEARLRVFSIRDA